MSQTSESSPGPGKSKRAFLLGLGFLGLAAFLYVLSAGPALRLAQQRKFPTEKFEAVYTPLMTAAEVVPGGGWIKRYMEWWALSDEAMGAKH